MQPLYLPPDLALILNSYCNDQRAVKVQCMLTEENFDEKITSEQQNWPIYKVIKKHESSSKEFSHNIYAIKDIDKKEELGIFHSIQIKDELYILSGDKAKFFTELLLRLLSRMYPDVISAFVHSHDIFELLEKFEKVMNIELNHKGAVKKQIFGFSPRTEVEYEISKEGREYHNFREAFREAQENDLWIDSIKVFQKNYSSRPRIQFTISRRGLITINRGTFDTFFANLLHPIAEKSKKRREQFKGRSRSEQTDKKPKPLIVQFGKNVFKETETRKEFSRILEKYPHCNYSIIHSGNPHVYLSVLDRNDNSSFSVRTFGDDSLLLIPQIRTSATSLMRFSEFLVTAFYEGVIQNFDQKKSLTD